MKNFIKISGYSIFVLGLFLLPVLVLGQGPTSTPYVFENPLNTSGNLMDLIDIITYWAFNIGLPIVVIFLVWAGAKFLFSKGNPAKVGEAKNMLWWAIVGLAIILIGRGFVDLIYSILDLGNIS